MPHLHLSLRNEDGEPREISSHQLTNAEALDLLRSAGFTGSQLVPWGSNYTFAVLLEDADGEEHLAIYKPRAGEAPLYDFPDGTLYRREVASYLLSEMLGWGLVPPTLAREGPHGIGSLQLYVTPLPDDEGSSFWRRKHEAVERMVLFDHIANNADRKIGHCLRDARGQVWGIDHGLTFNVQPKLRTVLWQYAGCPISDDLQLELVDLQMRSAEVRKTLGEWLTPAELDAFERRVNAMLQTGCYPELNPRRNIPYGW
jgi:hypothetical protein